MAPNGYVLASSFPFWTLTLLTRMTSTSRNSDLSVPWERTSLLNTPTYVGSPDFLSQVDWSKSNNQNELVAAYSDPKNPPTDPVTCAIVGTVSPNRHFLEAHGNYNPNYAPLEASKAQFQLISPADHPEFAADFNRGIQVIEVLQSKAIREGPDAQYLVVSDGLRKAVRF
jgi:hypothetical protein